jgi:uncharacterized protein YbcC (UPF0753/DUF2309 family)
MRATGTLIILLLLSSDLFAQTNVEIEMQRVRNMPDVLWVEESAQSRSQAYDAAHSSLMNLINERYSGALESAERTSDPEVLLRRRQLSVNYQSLIDDSRRNARVMLYASLADAEHYVKRYISVPYRTDQFISGEGSAATREDAIAMAQQDLISQMMVQIFSEQESRIEEVDLEITEEFRSKARAVSQMQLITARREALPVGDEYYAIVYMTIEDKEESFEMVRNQAISFVDEGDRFMSLNMPSRAMENYYRAYLISMNYNRSIEYSLGGEAVSNLRNALRLKIENYLYSMEIDVSPAYEHSRRTIEVPFNVSYSNESVEAIRYSYQVNGERSTDQVRHGQARIQSVNYFPDRRIETLPVRFSIDMSD